MTLSPRVKEHGEGRYLGPWMSTWKRTALPTWTTDIRTVIWVENECFCSLSHSPSESLCYSSLPFPPTNTITISKVLLLFAFLFMDINMAETLISVFTWGIYIGFVCGQTKLSLSDTQRCLSANLYQTVWKYPSIKIRWRHCHHWVQSSSRWKLRVHNLFKEQEDVQHGRGLSTIQYGPREICKKQII